jgi:hypothetical protein
MRFIFTVMFLLALQFGLVLGRPCEMPIATAPPKTISSQDQLYNGY